MRRKIVGILLLLSASSSIALDFITRNAVTYNHTSPRCASDIYYPSESNNQKLPVVIWFHGGGLTGGERYIPHELQTGKYVVVAPGYRLMPEASLEECIDDASAAVAWVMDSIASYGGDPTRIFISGHSAGGYLASMVGLDRSRLKKHNHTPDSIAGIIPFSGQVITHFAEREKKGLSPLTPTIDEYAPLYHIRKDAPPYIIITGDRELELFGRYEENAYMWRMLKLQGHPYAYIYELEGYNHGDMPSPAFHILHTHIKAILKN